MVRILTIIRAIFLIGLTIFLSRFVESENVYPEVLETTIITENNEPISIRWVKAESFLVNGNLPIWVTNSISRIYENKEIMEKFGTLIMYYDLEKSSAVVIVGNWNCIYGIIDVRYSIVCLPLDQLNGHQHIIGESSIIVPLINHEFVLHEKTPRNLQSSDQDALSSEENRNDFKMLVKTWVDSKTTSACHPARPQSSDNMNFPSTSHVFPLPKDLRKYEDYEDETIITYPEILIIIPQDVARVPLHVETLVLQYIVQFNAVAMLFAKLATHNIKIHINMAGIIIDSEGHFPSAELFVHDTPGGEMILKTITEYLNEVKDMYNWRRTLFYYDSFDLFIYSTTQDWREKVIDPIGFSTRVIDLMSVRKSHMRIEERKFLGSIVNYPNMLQHYVNIARKIAHLMTIQDDAGNFDSCQSGEQCSGIMRGDGQYCPHCLNWSTLSVRSFKRFLSKHTNRCFLRNFPRSLHRMNHPMRTFTPADQCLCYGFRPGWDTAYLNRPRRRNCISHLNCIDKLLDFITHSVITPIDGTPCDENDDTKVCWKQRCTSM